MFLAADTLAHLYLTEPGQPECDQQEMDLFVLKEVQLCHLCFADGSSETAFSLFQISLFKVQYCINIHLDFKYFC